MTSSPIYMIHDTRKFDKTSYSAYNKKSVFTEWMKAILHTQYETACHYTAEIDCSLWQDELWERIILFASKHVHIHNPSLPIFLNRQFLKFVELSKAENPSRLRNNDSHRKIVCQLVGILVYSGKGPIYELPKIDAHSAKIEELKTYPLHGVIQLVNKPGDSPLLMTILNGICIFLEQGLIHKALECLAILIQIEKDMKKNKAEILVNARTMKWIPVKYRLDWMWVLWEMLLTWNFKQPLLQESVKSLLALFTYQYVPARKNSRLPLVIHAFLLICHPLNIEQSIVDMKYMNIIKQACQNVDRMYQEIGTNYQETLQAEWSQPIESFPMGIPRSTGLSDLFVAPPPLRKQKDSFYAEEANVATTQSRSDTFNTLYGYDSNYTAVHHPKRESKSSKNELNSQSKLEIVEKLLYG